MKIEKNISLLPYNTFGIDVRADNFYEIYSIDDLPSILKQYPKHLILGGGSNMLFTNSYHGLVLKPINSEIVVLSEDYENVVVKVGSGVVWDELVKYTVDKNWSGLENLSYIPGTVGACPIQNIGAYGSEVKDTIVKVEGFYLESMQPFSFSNEQCSFGYRNSIFKQLLKSKVLIWSVTFKLSKIPKVNISYGNLMNELTAYKNITIANVREVVTNVRKSKLPEPSVIGNAGSFFKNPSVDNNLAQTLVAQFPNMPHFDNGDGTVKIPAAYLIEQCGWKGYRKGDAGVHDKQCLVLVNYEKATGEQILDLADEIIESVKNRFKIKLEIEVNIIE